MLMRLLSSTFVGFNTCRIYSLYCIQELHKDQIRKAHVRCTFIALDIFGRFLKKYLAHHKMQAISLCR
jgi:hypothetical protein